MEGREDVEEELRYSWRHPRRLCTAAEKELLGVSSWHRDSQSV
jgi:hypothetical protein